jgi:hypothetical protein
MAIKMLDAETGAVISGGIKMVFVCDMCGNTADYYNGFSNYSVITGNKVSKESYCSEICVKKAVAQLTA